MRSFACVLLLVLASGASAKEKMLPLPESAAAGLAGKTLVVTRHAKPSFVAMTAGKAMFALVGAAAMISAGNKIVADNAIADPADILERELAPALARHYGMTLQPSANRTVTEVKPAKIAATQFGTDFILDIRSGGWMFVYYPTDWNSYWAAYSAQVQLIDARSGAVVSTLACNTGTNKHPNSPSREAMLANGAALLKDMTQGFGWNCTQLLAKEQFHLAETEVTPTPPEFRDVLASFAANKAGTPAAAASSASLVDASPAVEAPAPVAAQPSVEAPATAAAPTEAAAGSATP